MDGDDHERYRCDVCEQLEGDDGASVIEGFLEATQIRREGEGTDFGGGTPTAAECSPTKRGDTGLGDGDFSGAGGYGAVIGFDGVAIFAARQSHELGRQRGTGGVPTDGARHEARGRVASLRAFFEGNGVFGVAGGDEDEERGSNDRNDDEG